MRKPEFKVVCIEETQHYTDKALVEKVGKIHAVFLYNKNSHTHCCEITPSYELHYIDTTYSDHIEDELQREEVDEHIQEANLHRELIEYHHVSGIDSIPEKYHVPFSEDWEPTEGQYKMEAEYRELLEEVIGDERANPNF